MLIITDRPAGSDASLNLRRKIEYSFPLDLILCDARRLLGGLKRATSSSKMPCSSARCFMKGLTAEWLAKAEEDYSVAKGLLAAAKYRPTASVSTANRRRRSTSRPFFREAGVRFGKTHDLEDCFGLRGRLSAVDAAVGDAQLLNDYAGTIPVSRASTQP